MKGVYVSFPSKCAYSVLLKHYSENDHTGAPMKSNLRCFYVSATLQGDPGLPGMSGLPGIPGKDGENALKGEQGALGIPGPKVE